MRSASVFRSVIALILSIPLAQAMAKRDALVEDEAFAAPAAVVFPDMLEIIQDAALEVIDLGKALREQIARGFFAANAAGAEHRDFPVLLRIETAGCKLLE